MNIYIHGSDCYILWGVFKNDHNNTINLYDLKTSCRYFIENMSHMSLDLVKFKQVGLQ